MAAQPAIQGGSGGVSLDAIGIQGVAAVIRGPLPLKVKSRRAWIKRGVGCGSGRIQKEQRSEILKLPLGLLGNRALGDHFQGSRQAGGLPRRVE